MCRSRYVRCAALWPLFAVSTLFAAPPGSTPPAYYWTGQSGYSYMVQTGATPDIVAQAAHAAIGSPAQWASSAKAFDP